MLFISKCFVDIISAGCGHFTFNKCHLQLSCINTINIYTERNFQRKKFQEYYFLFKKEVLLELLYRSEIIFFMKMKAEFCGLIIPFRLQPDLAKICHNL